MRYQAHRGVCTDCPENTMAAFRAAIAQGYELIEVDPQFTRDGVCVLLHDSTLNRTCRTAEDALLSCPVAIVDLTYDQARAYDAGSAKAPKFRGEPIPTLSEALELVRNSDTVLKVDNRICYFTDKQIDAIFDQIRLSDARAAITCKTVAFAERVREELPNAEIHYDGPVDEQTVRELVRICDHIRPTIWLQVCACTDTLCAMIHRYAALGIWKLSTHEEEERAEAWGADVIETDGELKPIRPFYGFFDSHSHTHFSSDSQCDPVDLCEAAIEAGLIGIAITDHMELSPWQRDSILSDWPKIQASFQTIQELKRRYAGRLHICAGIELAEENRHLSEMTEVVRGLPFDVVIGSVHILRGDPAYSVIDFSEYSESELIDFLDRYFTEMAELVETGDFDVLAHLDCPLRYVVGKYGRAVDMTRYDDIIGKILQTVVRRGIALEVNTSGWRGALNRTMPGFDILKRYYAMGGRRITLGADAHRADRVGNGFTEVAPLLQAIGFRTACYFMNRIPIYYAL